MRAGKEMRRDVPRLGAFASTAPSAYRYLLLLFIKTRKQGPEVYLKGLEYMLLMQEELWV